MRHKIFSVLSAAALIQLAALSACTSTTGTDATTSSSVPFYTVVANVADASSYPAGTVLLVRATITHAGVVAPSPTVAWTVLAGHGRLSAATTLGDTLGVTSVLWTLGDTAGANSLIIATASGADTLHVTGVVGSATILRPVSPDSSTLAARATATLQVRAFDRPGNATPNTAVTWTTSGGSLSATSTTTDATGLAQTIFTAPATAGVYFVTATLPGQASRTFQLVVR